MRLFDRIFRRKVASNNLDAAPQSGEPARPIPLDPDSFNVRVEDNQKLEGPLTRVAASLPVAPYEGALALLPDLQQVGEEAIVVATNLDSSELQGLSNVGISRGTPLLTYVKSPISPETSDRVFALLRISIALREVLTKRLFQELASSKFEIARLCDETMERMRIEAPVNENESKANFQDQSQTTDSLELDQSFSDPAPHRLPSEPAQSGKTILEELKRRIEELELENAAIRSNKIEGLGRLQFELSQQQQKIVDEKERLEKRILDADSQSKRLAEREATVWKNFSELQRREQRLTDHNLVRVDPFPQRVTELTEEVKRLRTQVDSGASSAKKKEATLVEEIRILKERASSAANTAYKNQMAIQEQLNQADLSIQKLLKAKNELERSLQSEIRSGSAPLNKNKRETQIGSTLISVSDNRIIDWMLEDASPEQAGVDHGYLGLTGEGPWPDQQIREMMEGAGFSLWMLPDADVVHVVVGRHSWDVAVLEQQIEAMEGRDLRIYSQEMWFAKLSTGRDPFDSGDHDLLMAFAKGHPALEYLIDRDDPWPEVSSGELVMGDGVFTEGIEFGVNSPLRNFGYQVGVSSGLSVAQRKALLIKFLEAKDLTFDGEASAEYRSHWGRPRSVQRLFRVASHIRWLIGWQGKSPYREQANEDWRGDLLWLKKTYYKPNLHKFRWPGV